MASTDDAAYNGISAGSVVVSINDNDTAGVTVSETGLTIVEGSSGSYTVVLNTQPAGDVTVTVSGHAGTDASLDQTTLTFTSTTWSTAQEVTVTAGEDGDGEDETDVTLSHAVSSTDDANYNGIAAGSVTVSINDNDTAGVTVSETGLTIVEGSSDSYTVVLNTQPAGDVTVTVSGHAGTDVSLDQTTLTFTSTTWSTAQEVTVTAGEDGDGDDETDVTLSHAVASTDDAAYNGISAGSVTVSINDNDTAGVTVSETGLTIVEGSSDSYTVVLNTQPAGDVTVTVSGHAGTDVSLDQTTLTFTSTTWSTAQEVTVTAGEDGDGDDETDVTLSHAVASTDDAAYNGISAGSVVVSINDNDTAGVTVSETGLTIVEGSSGSYTVVLNTQPAGDVTVTVSGHAGTDVSLDQTTLTFTSTTWSTAQEVTVTAGEDGDADDETDVTLSHAVASTDDAAYNGISAGSVVVSINDNDTAGVTVSETGLTIVEGSSDSYTVVLNTQPAGDVTVTVSGHAGTDVSLDQTTLTFTSTTWSTAQEVTVTAGEDGDGDDETDVTLSHAVASTDDAAYNGISAGSVVVSINDNDTADDPTVSVSFEQGTYTVAESDDAMTTEVQENQVAVVVKLSADPERTVTVLIRKAEQDGASSADYSGVPADVTFNSGDTEQRFTFAATDDSVDDDGESVKLTFGMLPTGVSAGTITESVVSITDDDATTPPIRSVQVSFGGDAYVVPEGSSVEVTIYLSNDPERTVTIPITKVNQDGATVADYSGVPADVTFNSGDTEQTFTFSAATDSDDDDGESVKLGFEPLPDGVTHGSPAEAIFSIIEGSAVTFDAASYVATEGGPDAAVTVKLSAPASRQVDILLTADGLRGAIATDWSGVPERLTFNAGDTAKTFILVAVDDEVEDDGEMVELGFGVLPDGFAAGSPPTALVALMNDDRGPSDPVRNQCPNDSGERIVLIDGGEIGEAERVNSGV